MDIKNTPAQCVAVAGNSRYTNLRAKKKIFILAFLAFFFAQQHERRRLGSILVSRPMLLGLCGRWPEACVETSQAVAALLLAFDQE